MLMKVTNHCNYNSGHGMKETWPLFLIFCQRFKSKFGQSLRRTRQKSRCKQFSKMKFKNCPTLNLMMFFKVLGSSRFSFEALSAPLTLTSFLSWWLTCRSKSFTSIRSVNLNKIKWKAIINSSCWLSEIISNVW